MRYTISVSALQGAMPPLKPIIAGGKPGVNGNTSIEVPCVWYLNSTVKAYRCRGTLGKKTKERSNAGKKIAASLKAFAEAYPTFYALIPTTQYPKGAVRGNFQAFKEGP
eukprot:TRINITY_DN1322_c0_g1_i3.p1 TRINITY_DN1322_c0_g1~~TRINITY_DN1322_c0_g1_i3.p1  ORF type:complete len:109 (-),score=3.17 TRINITY_DN1322_c0_g1_i3:260-586(-)